jgi:hypothetical protein
MFGPGSIFFGGNTPRSASPTAVNGADNGLTEVANIAQLGQVTGAIGDPAKLLHDSSIPFNGFSLLFTQIGGQAGAVPGSFPKFQMGAAWNKLSPLVRWQDSTAAELLSINLSSSDSVFMGSGLYLGNTGVPGQRTVAIGANVLSTITISFENTAIGFNCMQNAALPGIQNTGVGSGALQNVTGSGNGGFGWNALNNLLSGSGNVANGTFGLNGILTGNNNTGIGGGTGQVSDSNNNVFVGANVCSQQAFGDGNTVIGAFGAQDSIIGADNILIGLDVQLGGIGGVIANTTLIGVGQTSILSNIVALGIATQNILLGFTAPAVDTGARLQVNGQIQTTGPVTTAGKFRVGLEVAAAVVVDTTKYIEFENNGVVYKLITAV